MDNSQAKYLETVMDTVLDGLITIDRLGKIQTTNRAAEKIFGYSSLEMIGQNVRMLMPEPYKSQHDGYLSHYHQTGEKKIIGIGREILAQRKNGEIFPMELGVNQMEIDGEIMFVGTIRDITERKNNERSIQAYIKKLKTSNNELDQFAYIASHDLKEPLRGLVNNATFLAEDYETVLGDDGKRRISRIQFLCNRMEQLVDTLLYYSRLGRQEMAVEDVDLNQVVKDIVELTCHEAEDYTVEVKISEPLPTITCDKVRVTELYRNLISNAIKYNKRQQRLVEVGLISGINPASKEDVDKILYVKDNGMGIEEKFFQDIFRIFKRLNSEDDSVRGTGVGLTFVKKIVERHSGSIWLESEMGEGTTFYFTLNKVD